jgi:integrase
MFDYAVAQDAVQANPARVKVTISRATRKDAVRALTEVEADAICDGLRSDEVASKDDLPDLVEWMLGTGARIGESIAARGSVIDLEHGTWEINATLIRVRREGLVVQLRPKTAAGWRVLALPPFCVAMLHRRAEELKKQPETFLVMDDRKRITPAPGPVTFPAPKGWALRDPRNTNRDLRAALDRLGFDWVTSHVFRKTVATRLDEAGLSARQIADQLGHAKPSMTQDVYMGRNVVSSEAARVLER